MAKKDKVTLPAIGKPKPKKTSVKDLGKKASKNYMSDKGDKTLLKSKMPEAKNSYKSTVEYDKQVVGTSKAVYGGKDKYSKKIKRSINKAATKQAGRTGV